MTKILPVRLDPSPTVGKTEQRSKRPKPVDSARAGRPVTLVRPKFVPIPPSLRHEFIATAAYFKAEARSFAPGHELEDWFAAEAEFEELIARRYGRPV